MLSVRFAGVLLLAALNTVVSAKAPTARVTNGTYVGVHSNNYQQDFFLGVPFAQPPVGDLRFRVPQSLNATWNGMREATTYSKECYGYGSIYQQYGFSEDCLYLNIVRPSGYQDQKLPIGLWIHGGGLDYGGAVDQRYNLSFIVQNSVKIGKPIIGISVPYRLTAWGFIGGREVQEAGQTNLGLRDQRLALHWVQENIEAFGGDPRKVIIWGESAGAASVGMHLVAYGGRDDHLFRGAILESGAPVFYINLNRTAQWQDRYDLLVAKTGCSNSTDSLQCLRQVPTKKLNKVINSTEILSSSGTFAIDNDIIQGKTSKQVKSGRFVKVPIISGATSDEGTDFSPTGVTNTSTFYDDITASGSISVSPSFARQILKAYPDIPARGIPGIDELPPHYRPGPPYGKQWRRSAAYWGDALMIANRRLTCEAWAKAEIPAYCFRFNAIPAGTDQEIGVTHFSEVAFVFNNTDGVGYGPQATPPFQGKRKAYRELAHFISSNWVSFVSDLDPNACRAGKEIEGPPRWPRYSLSELRNFVFDANVTSYVEADTFRRAGVKLINDHALSEYSR